MSKHYGKEHSLRNGNRADVLQREQADTVIDAPTHTRQYRPESLEQPQPTSTNKSLQNRPAKEPTAIESGGQAGAMKVVTDAASAKPISVTAAC